MLRLPLLVLAAVSLLTDNLACERDAFYLQQNIQIHSTEIPLNVPWIVLAIVAAERAMDRAVIVQWNVPWILPLIVPWSLPLTVPLIVPAIVPWLLDHHSSLTQGQKLEHQLTHGYHVETNQATTRFQHHSANKLAMTRRQTLADDDDGHLHYSDIGGLTLPHRTYCQTKNYHAQQNHVHLAIITIIFITHTC